MNETLRLHHIAGFCTEDAIWTMIIDLCDIVRKNPMKQFLPTPQSVIVDADRFLMDVSQEAKAEFLPPECQGMMETASEAQFVWALGANIYFASSGRILFGGYGGQYQQAYPKVALPGLQKKHQALTPVMQRCLAWNPAERPGVQELQDIAEKERARCLHEKRQAIAAQGPARISPTPSYDNWPEEMIEL